MNMTIEQEKKQESQENTISPVSDVASLQGVIESDPIPAGAGCAGRTETGPGARQENEKEEQVIVRKIRSHFYNISTRTWPVKRELRGRVDSGRAEVRFYYRKGRGKA